MLDEGQNTRTLTSFSSAGATPAADPFWTPASNRIFSTQLVFFALFSSNFWSCFSMLVRMSFLTLLESFLDPMLGLCWELFRVFFPPIRWGPILKSFWHWFFIDLRFPRTSKIELSPTRKCNFLLLAFATLSSFWGSVLDPKWLPKSSPRASKTPSETKSKF